MPPEGIEIVQCSRLRENSGSMEFAKTKEVSGNRSFCQRVSSPTTTSPMYEVVSPTSNVSLPTPLNYRIQGHFCPYMYINYSSFFNPLRSQSKKYFGHWVPKWLAYKRWRTDIRRWRIDFIRWWTGRWRTDLLAKWQVSRWSPRELKFVRYILRLEDLYKIS